MKDSCIAATFTYVHECTIVKLILEKEDIPYFFENETMVGVFPFYSNALGGIHLRVHRKDLERVRKIIEDLNTSSPLSIV